MFGPVGPSPHSRCRRHLFPKLLQQVTTLNANSFPLPPPAVCCVIAGSSQPKEGRNGEEEEEEKTKSLR